MRLGSRVLQRLRNASAPYGAAGAVAARCERDAAAAQPGDQTAPTDTNPNPGGRQAQGDALLVQHLCDVSAVLRQRSLASGALGSLQP